MKTILVVDDEPNIRQLIVETLSDEGYNVYAAENGYKAIMIIENQPIDLVILDIRMPQCDGLKALGKIKEFNKSLPVILHTAYGEYKTSDYHTWGADAIVQKSLTPDAVVQKSSNLDELLDEINKIFSHS
jgi:CheY-like chemotaxis protein